MEKDWLDKTTKQRCVDKVVKETSHNHESYNYDTATFPINNMLKFCTVNY